MVAVRTRSVICLDDRHVTRDQYIAATRALIAEGERISERPSMPALRTWIAASDELLRNAWGSMDRYHLSWLMVGRPTDVVRGRAMTDARRRPPTCARWPRPRPRRCA